MPIVKNSLDKQYFNLLDNILDNGIRKRNRTIIDTISISGAMIRHDMSEGFPLLTTKKVFYKTMAVELEGFIKGISDKRWYQDKGCHIWDSWSNPETRPEAMPPEEWHDLGRIYGSQWRDFNSQNYDQLSDLIYTLKTNPESRRMIVSAWNPLELHKMALPPCHFSFQVIVRGEYLDLIWNQRSVDVFLGLPFNIASYGLLLSLLSKQFNYKPGILSGMLGDVHIYQNHIGSIKKQFLQNGYDLPELKIKDSFYDIREFDSCNDFEIVNYRHGPVIKAQVAV